MNAKRVRQIVTLAFLLALAVFSWFFARTNSALITVDLLAGAVSDVSLWLVVFVTFAIGAGVAGLLTFVTVVRMGALALRQKRTIKKLEAELTALRGTSS